MSISLEVFMWNLFKTNNEIRLNLVWSLMTFTFKCKLCLWSHSWLNLNHFFTDGHLLCLAISMYDHTFKVNFFSTSIIEFFESTFDCNRQVLKLFRESTHHLVSTCFDGTYLITILVKSNSKRVSCSKESFKDI